MIAGVCKETEENEKRVALTPEGVKTLIGLGIEVHIEKGAGLLSSYKDEGYIEAGATLAENREDLLKKN